jgi:hypothetical protein
MLQASSRLALTRETMGHGDLALALTRSYCTLTQANCSFYLYIIEIAALQKYNNTPVTVINKLNLIAKVRLCSTLFPVKSDFSIWGLPGRALHVQCVALT